MLSSRVATLTLLLLENTLAHIEGKLILQFVNGFTLLMKLLLVVVRLLGYFLKEKIDI